MNLYDQWSPAWQHHLKAAYLGDAASVQMVSPKTVKELTAVVTQAHQEHLKLLVAGQGTKLAWGIPAKKIDLLLSTQNLDGVVDHAVGDMTVTVQAGMTFAALQTLLAKHNQWIPLDPVYANQATVGGILATRDAGSLRHRYGGVRDLCLGLTFVRSDGQIAKAGGRVVKNVAGYDLMKLFAGSFGTLGIVTELTLRAYPLPERSGTVLIRGEMEEVADFTQELRQSTLTPTAFDIWTGQNAASNDITLALRFQSLGESVLAQTERVYDMARTLGAKLSQSLKAEILSDGDDAEWWATSAQHLRESPRQDTVICQIGILPASAVSCLATIQQKVAQTSVALQGRVHAGSGVGQLRLTGTELDCRRVLADLRTFLNQSEGYLSVLEAPLTLKKAVEVWGYSGNALAAMRKLKERFDPQGGLNPGRFVGGL